jgi:hypothetical protein
MILRKKNVSNEATESALIAVMMKSLASIYSNKSSDEYKSAGDITKTSEYKTTERLVSDLKTIKKFSKTDANDMNTLFLTLHRPVWKSMVASYIHEPNEKNSLFTAVYTVGYRVLIGELSRIYSSTEATGKGIAYKPDKISRRQNMVPFIRSYNASIESKLNTYLKSTAHLAKSYTEGVIEFMDKVTDITKKVYPALSKLISNVWSADKWAGAVLNHHYDEAVSKYREIAAMYIETKNAYEAYVRIPEAQQSEKVKSKYMKLLKKYEIKMNNAKAAIDHYDSRALEEAKDEAQDFLSNPITAVDSSDDKSSSDQDDKKDDDSSDSKDAFDF